MRHSFKRLVLFSVFISSFAHQSFAATSEIYGEIMGFSQAKGIEKSSITFPCPSKLPKDIPTETRIQIREFIEEKMKEVHPHDFFSIDRFSRVEPTEEQDNQLIDHWSLWYFGKSLEIALGGINARKDLELTLASKIEFYENIAFMTTDPALGLKAKAFYKKQLEAVNQLPSE